MVLAGFRGKSAVVSGVLTALLLVSACSQKKVPDATGPTSSSSNPTASAASTPQVSPAVLSFTPGKDATAVNPLTPIKVGVSGGLLSAVKLTNLDGKQVKGAFSADKRSWRSAEVLGYNHLYSLEATATNPAGQQTSTTSTFSTVKPANMTMPYIQTAAGGGIAPGVTFGVGQVVRIHFDEPIPDRKAAQAAISVKTEPAQVGGFSWLDDSNVYWRTKNYMKSGTKVTVTAKVYGKNFGDSLYGQADTSAWFRVGDKHISIVDDRTKIIKVYSNDRLIRAIPTSMGRDARIKGDAGPIDLRTNSGPHVVVGGEKKINMDSASFGLSKGDEAYKKVVPVGVRISYDGEYVHWADWSIPQQGKVNVSHGCLNVSPENAYWFYDFSVPGDIVDVRNTGRNLAVWNSGFWNISWAGWLANSAA